MIEKCADIIAEWLISCEVVKETDKELYSYAMYSVFLSLSPLLLAIGFGIVMGCVGYSVMIILPFMIIRKFSGGYHTRHAWSCLICSNLLLFMCIILSFHIRCGWILTLITMGAAVSLIYFSPIDNENRVLNQDERICYKRTTAIIVLILLVAGALLSVCQLNAYSVCISIGIILSAGLQLPCIFKKLIKRIVK